MPTDFSNLAPIVAVVIAFLWFMHKVVLLLTAAIKELTTELRKGNKEAAQRNGHLGEQNVQIIKLVSEHNKEVANIGGSIMDAVSNVKEQHVEHQHVDNVNVEE